MALKFLLHAIYIVSTCWFLSGKKQFICNYSMNFTNILFFLLLPHIVSHIRALKLCFIIMFATQLVASQHFSSVIPFKQNKLMKLHAKKIITKNGTKVRCGRRTFYENAKRPLATRFFHAHQRRTKMNNFRNRFYMDGLLCQTVDFE